MPSKPKRKTKKALPPLDYDEVDVMLKKMTEDSLNNQEDAIMHNLTLAWRGFLQLRTTHPDHNDLFRHGIHECQQIIMWRKLQRLQPENYPTYSPCITPR